MKRLERATILEALETLAAHLPAGEPYRLIIVGGAALVLLYGARSSTKDVDAFLLDAGDNEVLRRAARKVSVALDLPDDWLNDGAKGYVHGMAIGERLLVTENLVAETLAPEQLLAMKLCAWRDDVDFDDAALLLSKLTGGRETVWSRIEQHLVPGRQLKAQYAFADLWEAQHGTS